MNISGIWTYNEDFGFGKSEGEAKFLQTGGEVSGTINFTEKVENDYKIDVIEQVKGKISNNKLILESIEVTAKQNDTTIEYRPNTFEVHLISESKLVGSTFDSENVCGVFVMERKEIS